MSAVSRWLLRIGCIAFVLLIVARAFAHFRDGVMIDRAIPVPSYMVAGRPVPKWAYAHAAAALAGADAADGVARIAGAEAALRAGAPDRSQIGPLRSALMRAPADARGWLLLAQAARSSDPHQASVAMSQALLLAPYDYWLAGMRAQIASGMWSALDEDAKSRALQQIRLLWEEPQLRVLLPAVLDAPGAASAFQLAFAGNRDEFITINRWISARRRQAADGAR